MDVLSTLTADNWIAVIGITIPILIAWLANVHHFAWSLFKKYILDRDVEVISQYFDSRISSLNDQKQACSFLDVKGHLSIDSILKNHHAPQLPVFDEIKIHPIPWQLLQMQFGAGYPVDTAQGRRDFKKAFIEQLKKIHILAYQGAKFDLDDSGLTLFKSSLALSPKQQKVIV